MSQPSPSTRPPMHRCPGLGGRVCGSFMSPLSTDPHPTCVKCRGHECTRDHTCDVCKDWPEEQWKAFGRKKKKKSKKDKTSSSSSQAHDLSLSSASPAPPPRTPAPAIAPSVEAITVVESVPGEMNLDLAQDSSNQGTDFSGFFRGFLGTCSA